MSNKTKQHKTTPTKDNTRTNFDIKLLKERVMLLNHLDNLAVIIGEPSVRLADGSGYTTGTGLKGELGKLNALLNIWSAKPSGIAKLREQATQSGMDFNMYMANWKARQIRSIAAKTSELKECTKQLAGATAALRLWESNNPSYKDLSAEDCQQILDPNTNELPFDSSLDKLAVAEETQEAAESYLDSILNGRI
jgi:hypothetical protein